VVRFIEIHEHEERAFRIAHTTVLEPMQSRIDHARATFIGLTWVGRFVVGGAVAEALNAGAWAVGVAETGNGGYETLMGAGADYAVSSVADLPGVIDQIEKQLSA